MRAAIAFALAPLLVAWSSAGRQPQPEPQPPPPVAAPTVTPVASPSSAPTSSPLPATPPAATPTPPAFRFIYTPPPATPTAADAPRIVEVDLSDQTIHENSDVSLRVVTSPAVASVVISALGHDAPVPQVGPGLFGAQSHVPSVPFFFLNRTYSIQIRASNADGRTDSVNLPVRLVR